MSKIQVELEKFVGRRYKRLEDIQIDMKKLGFPDPCVGEDQFPIDEEDQSPIDGNDHELICCLNPELDEALASNYQDFTLYYLKDRCNNYYITEVNTWGII